jgi:hypothetical protein
MVSEYIRKIAASHHDDDLDGNTTWTILVNILEVLIKLDALKPGEARYKREDGIWMVYAGRSRRYWSRA